MPAPCPRQPAPSPPAFWKRQKLFKDDLKKKKIPILWKDYSGQNVGLKFEEIMHLAIAIFHQMHRSTSWY